MRRAVKIAKAVAVLAWNRLRAKQCRVALVDMAPRYPDVFGTCRVRCERWEGHHGKHAGSDEEGTMIEW